MLGPVKAVSMPQQLVQRLCILSILWGACCLSQGRKRWWSSHPNTNL